MYLFLLFSAKKFQTKNQRAPGIVSRDSINTKSRIHSRVIARPKQEEKKRKEKKRKKKKERKKHQNVALYLRHFLTSVQAACALYVQHAIRLSRHFSIFKFSSPLSPFYTFLPFIHYLWSKTLPAPVVEQRTACYEFERAAILFSTQTPDTRNAGSTNYNAVIAE